MNTKLLRQVKRIILDEPKRLYMTTWIYTALEGESERPPCGTLGCIAGWAALLDSGGADNLNKAKDAIRGKGESVAKVAKKALELGVGQANRLFYLPGWPRHFHHSYVSAKTPKERAKIAAERIDKFIATGGKV